MKDPSVLTNNVFIYYIGTKTWSSMTPLPNLTFHLTAVFLQGYIYVFGGENRGTKVERILPHPTATWELVGNTKQDPSYVPLVIPYNY